MKQKILLLIVLMSVALAGLIGFQVKWLWDTYLVEEAQFEEEMTAAMSRAMAKVLSRSAITILTRPDSAKEYIVRPNLMAGSEISIDTIFIEEPDVPSTFSYEQIESSSHVQLPAPKNHVFFKNAEVKVFKKKDTVLHLRSAAERVSEIFLGLDSTKAKVDLKGYFKSEVTGKEETVRVQREAVIFEDLDKFLEKNKENVIKVELDLSQSINAEKRKSETFEKEVKKVHSFLKEEFIETGLDTAFFFGLTDKSDETFAYIEKPELAEMLKKEGKSVKVLMPSIGAMLNLFVWLPNAYQTVWQKMWPNLVASVLLIGLIAYGYGFALLTILRQKRLSEMKTDFINNMTHEFKTPISTVSLALEALMKFGMGNDPKKADQYLSIAQNENSRLGLMVEKVLKIAASERKDIKLNYETLDLHELIKQVSQNVSVQLQERQGQVVTELKAASPKIQADRVHLGNVIYNLLDNALKYSKNSPLIRIATEELKDGIRLSIIDNGIGISKQHMKNIFDKFYRVPTGNVHNVKGFGLGLSYVSLIVEKHQGTVEVESEVGKGSSFNIFLPYLS